MGWTSWFEMDKTKRVVAANKHDTKKKKKELVEKMSRISRWQTHNVRRKSKKYERNKQE